MKVLFQKLHHFIGKRYLPRLRVLGRTHAQNSFLVGAVIAVSDSVQRTLNSKIGYAIFSFERASAESGKLIGGTEPDGTKPAKVYKVAQLVRLRKMLLGESPFSSKEAAEQFDFNTDGRVDMFDEVLLRQLLVNQTK